LRKLTNAFILNIFVNIANVYHNYDTKRQRETQTDKEFVRRIAQKTAAAAVNGSHHYSDAIESPFGCLRSQAPHLSEAFSVWCIIQGFMAAANASQTHHCRYLIIFTSLHEYTMHHYH